MNMHVNYCMNTKSLSTKMQHLSIFLISMSLLIQQILIVRIFSGTMAYDYVFASISLTMLGLTLGAILVFFYFRNDIQNNAQSTLSDLVFFYAIASFISVGMGISYSQFAGKITQAPQSRHMQLC